MARETLQLHTNYIDLAYESNRIVEDRFGNASAHVDLIEVAGASKSQPYRLTQTGSGDNMECGHQGAIGTRRRNEAIEGARGAK